MNKQKVILMKMICVLLIGLLFNSCDLKNDITPEQAKEIAKEAYIYGFPMVVNYKTMYMYAVDEKSSEYKGGFNNLTCMARVYTPKDKAVVTPNSDTPYCMFWGDIRSEPLVLTIPEIEDDRFYEVQLIDLFTHNFNYVSTVATGNVPGNYLITGPDWEGETPEGIKEIINCETQFLFAIIRTQLFNPEDLDNITAIQDAYQFQPLSTFLKTESPSPLPALEFPEWNEGDQFTTSAFNYINFMLSLVQLNSTETILMKRFAKIGIGTSTSFDISQFDSEIQKAIEKGVKEGFDDVAELIKKNTTDPLASAKIFGTREFLKASAQEHYSLNDFFMLRMAAAHTGLYGNSGSEAVYPAYFVDSEGQKLDASENNYKILIEEHQFPPVSAFWSLTIYDANTQLLIDNPLNRYLLNSTMMEQYKLGKDGSLTFYIQKQSPGKDLEQNWLPAPDGAFYCVMRLYGPEDAVLKGEWVNPPMVKVN